MGRAFFILCFIIQTNAYAAEKGNTGLTPEWHNFIEERKALLEKIGNLKCKQEECVRLVQEKKGKISQNQEKISQCLRLLLRVGRVSPLRFLVDLKSTRYAIRGIILMRTLAASLNSYMRQMQADLTELKALTTDINSKKRDYEGLLATVVEQKNTKKSEAHQIAEELREKEEARLAEETDLDCLLEESHCVLLKKEKKVKSTASKENLPFSRLEQPVVGEILNNPELQKKFSPQAKGLIFKTRKNADVCAVAKGVVVFKGPFRTQGEILILDHGNRIHTVYMGMDKISIDMGQSVYAGDRIGTMAHYGKKDPLLYLELRKDGNSIDPLPYLATD